MFYLHELEKTILSKGVVYLYQNAIFYYFGPMKIAFRKCIFMFF